MGRILGELRYLKALISGLIPCHSVVRLQKQKTRVVKGKEYFRWTVVIPPKKIDELGWNDGTELESKTKKGRLILRRAKAKS